MKYSLLLATHHKTGTNWFRNIFKEIADLLDVPFVDISQHRNTDFRDHIYKKEYIEKLILNNDTKYFIFDDHSYFPNFNEAVNHKVKGLHFIRDPRDVIISATKYHTTANEPWLHIPYKCYNNLTYQEKINSFVSMNERIIFEMNNSSKKIISEMYLFMSNSLFKHIKYEDLIDDTNMTLWHSICENAGFKGHEIIICMQSFWNNSLCGANIKTGHIQNGSKKQYVTFFNNDMLKKIESIYKNEILTLGYDLEY